MPGRAESQVKNRYCVHLRKNIESPLESDKNMHKNGTIVRKDALEIEGNKNQGISDPTDLISYSNAENEGNMTGEGFNRLAKLFTPKRI